MTLRHALENPRLCAARGLLQRYEQRTETVLPPRFWDELSRLKQRAIDDSDQPTAKAVWCMETIGRIQDHFVSAYMHMQSNEFQEAWHRLDRCEVETSFLDPHFSDEDREFGIEHIRVHTKRFQELFPVRAGISPAFLLKQFCCSICKMNLTLRSRCSHVVGEIYGGEMCCREITDAEILHVALVKNPAQRYSVIFPQKNQKSIFVLVRYVCCSLRSPWHRWSYDKEERKQHHPAFKAIGRNDRCPCGSRQKYKHCCLNREKVDPHFHFVFQYGPPADLESFEF